MCECFNSKINATDCVSLARNSTNINDVCACSCSNECAPRTMMSQVHFPKTCATCFRSLRMDARTQHKHICRRRILHHHHSMRMCLARPTTTTKKTGPSNVIPTHFRRPPNTHTHRSAKKNNNQHISTVCVHLASGKNGTTEMIHAF